MNVELWQKCCNLQRFPCRQTSIFQCLLFVSVHNPSHLSCRDEKKRDNGTNITRWHRLTHIYSRTLTPALAFRVLIMNAEDVLGGGEGQQGAWKGLQGFDCNGGIPSIRDSLWQQRAIYSLQKSSVCASPSRPGVSPLMQRRMLRTQTTQRIRCSSWLWLFFFLFSFAGELGALVNHMCAWKPVSRWNVRLRLRQSTFSRLALIIKMRWAVYTIWLESRRKNES